MDNNVDEIKSKIDIVDFLSEYIQVKPAGVNFRALCPFHKEKTPSFFISPERQIWHCFGCGKGGDIFGFLMEMEGIEFPEALKILAEKAGVKINQYDRQAISPKTKIFDICRLSADFFHKILLESFLAEPARKYLKERGVSQEIINEFKLGFAPDKWDTILNFLINRGYKISDIEAAGLITQSSNSNYNLSAGESNSKHYDRFRNRIIFPISDPHGQILGFTARIMPGSKDEDKVGKYINSPETEIYNKSRVLYALDKAKIEIKEQDSLILVEGNMDVLACFQAGYRNVVCTSGTALTQEQINLIQRYTENIILSFDVDLAGQNATQRGIDLLLQQGLDVSVLKLSIGKDPDECIKKDAKQWEAAVKNPVPIMEYYFSLAFSNRDLKKIEEKKQVSKILLPVIVKLGDPVERDLWLRRLSDDLDVSEVSLRDALRRVKSPRTYYSSESKANSSERIPRGQQVSERFLSLILKYPEKGDEYIKQSVSEMFTAESAQEIFRLIRDYYNQNKKIVFEKIKDTAKKDRKITDYFNYLSFLLEKDFSSCEDFNVDKELKYAYNFLRKSYLNKRVEEMTQELKQQEKQGDKEEIKKTTSKIVKLSKEIIFCE